MSPQQKTTKEKRIYLDNSASTAVDERALAAMEPCWREVIGNAGSIHEEGREAKEVVDTARAKVAEVIHALPENIIFTSGGTESNNLAIQGVVHERVLARNRKSDISILTTSVEHNSVLDTFSMLDRDGVQATYVPTDTIGKVDLEALERAMTPQTVLLSLIHVNNEIGTVQDVGAVMKIVRKYRKEHDTIYPLVHLDACQAPTWVPVHVDTLGVDFISLDSQKVYGPKGIGALFIRDMDTIQPIFYGGNQEQGLRPGTPPTPLIVGFATALGIVEEERDSYVSESRRLRDWCIDYVRKAIPDVVVNGPLDDTRIAGNINFTFSGVEGEQLVIELDTCGIAVSTGSACSFDASAGSHVIKALHKEGIDPTGTLRMTLSRHTTQDEIEKVAQCVVNTVQWLREAH